MVKYEPALLDDTFAALADPTRRAILAQLAQGECAVGELAEPHAMSLPAVSKHLAVLESAGLLLREKTGRVVRCRLEATPMQAANEWLERYQIFWRGQLDSLAQFLDSPEPPEIDPCPPCSNPKPLPSNSRAATRTHAKKSSARGPTRRR
ncbi:MAG: ArsR/SmtB family transcription factor [Stenotrophobium sp.]